MKRFTVYARVDKASGSRPAAPSTRNPPSFPWVIPRSVLRPSRSVGQPRTIPLTWSCSLRANSGLVTGTNFGILPPASNTPRNTYHM